MPAISIRTSAEAYIADANYGSACKTLVQQTLSIAPDLSIGRVIKDSLTEYDVLLRIMDNPDVGFRIMNSNAILYLYCGYFDAQGDFFSTNTSAIVAFFERNSYVKAISIGVDGCLMYIIFKSSRTSSSYGITYGIFTGTGEMSPICGVGTTNFVDTQYPTFPGVPFGRSALYIPNRAKDSAETIYFSNENFISAVVRAGYGHALMPTAWRGETMTRGFINIKWGGKYNIYTLYNATGIVETLPGETVSINGVEMLSPGYVTVIE